MLQNLLRGSWSFRGGRIRPFSQVRNSSFEICGWLWVSWVAQVTVCSSGGSGGLFSQSRPSNCRIASSPRRGFTFFIVLFPSGLLLPVAQTYHFPWMRSNAPFLVGQGSHVVFLLLHQLRLSDTLGLFSPSLQSPWLSFSYWWCTESYRKNEWRWVFTPNQQEEDLHN